MTQEELEQKAMDYEIDCIADVYKDDVCELQYAYSATKLEQAYIDGYAQGEQDLMASDTIVKKEFVDNLEKEKCELLGLIQAKDKLIIKMKNCTNCKCKCTAIKHKICKNYDKWELAE